MIPPFDKPEIDNTQWGTISFLIAAFFTFLGKIWGTKSNNATKIELEKLKGKDDEVIKLEKYIEKLRADFKQIKDAKEAYEKKWTTARVTFKVVLNQMKRTSKDKDIVAMMEEVGNIFDAL